MYRVIISKSVQKQLKILPNNIRGRILARLSNLESDPRPPDVKKLKGRDAWRVRVGDYRVIYDIHDRELQVIVVTVGHRRDVYRYAQGRPARQDILNPAVVLSVESAVRFGFRSMPATSVRK